MSNRTTVGLCSAALLGSAALSGCLGDAFAHCDLKQRELGPNEKVNGVDATAIVDSLVGAHAGTLTWHRTDDETELTFTTARKGAAVYRDERDCDDGDITFEVPVVMELVSGDGLIHGEENIRVVLDPDGAVARLEARGSELVTWRVPVDYTELYEARVTDPRIAYHPGARLELSIDPASLIPTGAKLDLIDTECGDAGCVTSARETLATARF